MTFSATSRSPGFLHGAADHIPDQPNRLPEGQGRGEAALALPQVAALPHEVNNRLTSPSPKVLVTSSWLQKNTSSACSIAPVATMCSPSRRTQARRTGHAGEVAGLFLSDDRIPLIDLQQLVELGE